MLNHVKLERIQKWLLVGVVASLAFFGLTSPKSLPPPMLIVGFVVLGTLLYCVLRLLLLVTGLHTKLPAAYQRGLLLAGTILPVILLVMQSIGQLTMRDVLTLVGLFCIGVFYVGRVRRAQ